MSREKNPIDKLFQERLDGHKIEPSEKVWNQIEAEVATKSNGAVWIRAAVIALLFGLSAVTYYQVSQGTNPSPLPDESSVAGSIDNLFDKDDTEPTKTTEQKAEKEKKVEETGNEGEKKQGISKPMPLIKNKNSSNKIYVSQEKLNINVQEIAFEEIEEEEELIEKSGPPASPKIRVKVKLKPKTVESFYANAETKEASKKGFKDKVLAYAGDQMQNLLNGEPVELPKAEADPKLELNWNKLFKD